MNAIKPNNLFAQFPSLGNAELSVDDTHEPDDEDKSLHFLSTTDGWHIIDTHIDTLKEELDNIVIEAMSKGASFEEIGQKTAVKEVAKAYLDRIKAKVAIAKESMEKAANG